MRTAWLTFWQNLPVLLFSPVCRLVYTAHVVNKVFITLCYRNFQAFNQQLAELWHQEPFLKSVPGPAGDFAKVSAACMNKIITTAMVGFAFSDFSPSGH